MHITKHCLIKILAILIVFILVYASLDSPGTGDYLYWIKWLNLIRENGVSLAFAKMNDNYPPLILLIINFFEFISMGRLSDFQIIKLSIVIMFLISLAMLYLWHSSVLETILFAFALCLNSLYLGYVDIYIVPFIIGAFWCLSESKNVYAVCLFIISFMIKWQPLIIMPFIMIYLLDIDSRNVKLFDHFKASKFALVSILVLLPICFYFGFNEIRSSFMAATRHDFLSANALNVNWIATWIVRLCSPEVFGGLDGGHVRYIQTSNFHLRIGRVIFFAVYLYTLLKFFKSSKTIRNLYIHAIIGYISYFILNVGVHENHLFLAVVLSFLLVHEDVAWVRVATFVAITQIVNLYLFYGISGRGMGNRLIFNYLDATVVFSFCNLIGFIYLIKKLFFADEESEHLRSESSALNL